MLKNVQEWLKRQELSFIVKAILIHTVSIVIILSIDFTVHRWLTSHEADFSADRINKIEGILDNGLYWCLRLFVGVFVGSLGLNGLAVLFDVGGTKLHEYRMKQIEQKKQLQSARGETPPIGNENANAVKRWSFQEKKE